ncbi:MAG TPA: ABC transporter ATP-binding protein [Planctomycetota bacterium]|jgi:ABC-type polysaccharide/polyol phosphate transport system ATPase subunit|nr:ABC transporter ATP-binding protein [Planctomycetota bacterium]
MSDSPAVKATSLSKCYRVYPDSSSRLVEWFSGKRLKRHTEKWALRDISFEVPKGSALGIVGANGAGKSTLLKIISGVTTPTSGKFEISGQLGSLLELGAGFHPGFTGRANVFMNAAIMGIPKREVKERFNELAEFAELGDYLDRPVRTYSSGMSMRLGYAVAMLAHPEILVLDEILAVGDQRFQKKCMDHIRRIRMSGTSILFVSHSIYHVRQMCDRAIWIQDGHVVAAGDPTTVTDDYVNFTYAHAGGQEAQKAERGVGTGVTNASHLTQIRISKNGDEKPCSEFRTGDVMTIRLSFRNADPKDRVHLGIICNRNDDLQVFTTRSHEAGISATGETGSLMLRVPVQLAAGEYYISAFLLDETCDHVLDQRLAFSRFRVSYDGMEKGVYIAPVTWMPGDPVR